MHQERQQSHTMVASEDRVFREVTIFWKQDFSFFFFSFEVEVKICWKQNFSFFFLSVWSKSDDFEKVDFAVLFLTIEVPHNALNEAH